MSEIASEFLKHITLEDKLKEMFENLKWQKTSCKYSVVKEMLTESVKERKDVNYIIFGSEEYIKKMNENINKWMNNNKKVLQNIFVQIIDAYEFMQFNNNLNDILSVHDKILNTSGEKEIEEVFEGYKKIVDYYDNYIKIKTNNMFLIIDGNNLDIKEITDDELVIDTAHYVILEKNENNMVNEIRKLEEYEKEYLTIRSDLNKLEGERGNINYERKRLETNV